MKLLIINGSAHLNGTTTRAILEMKKIFDSNNIKYDIYTIGNLDIKQCIGCSSCRKHKICIHNDLINEIGQKLDEYDGLIVASPVHYASPTGNIITFLDRLFYAYGIKLRYKIFAAISVARRGGCSSSLDCLNKYGFINNMLMIGSQYWNMVHGSNNEDVVKDLEGMQTLRTLTNNIIYLLKLKELGKLNNLEEPILEKVTRTNFIREDLI